MTMELAECIKENFDESLREYIQSEEYQQRQDKVDEMVIRFELVCVLTSSFSLLR